MRVKDVNTSSYFTVALRRLLGSQKGFSIVSEPRKHLESIIFDRIFDRPSDYFFCFSTQTSRLLQHR